MNPPKRFGLLLLLLAFLSPRYLQASCGPHPFDPTASFLGSFVITVPISSGVASFSLGSCQGHIEVCVWRRINNRVDYIMNVGSIGFSGDCDDVDQLLLPTILDQFADGAVSRGIDSGYNGCGDTTEVWGSQCAERSGSGEETGFSPCNPLWCKRRYVITCSPPSTMVPVRLAEDSVTCPGIFEGCEVGCKSPE